MSLVLSGTGPGLTLSIADLPLWQGVRKEPGVQRRFPFRLGFAGPGPIRQTTEAEVVAEVLRSYAGDDYAFLTKPPGASAWADSLGDAKVAAVMENWTGQPPRAILEVGAGSTYVGEKLLARFGEGPSYTIVDPAVRDQGGPIQVVSDYFPAPALEGRRFDLIIGFNCLEHVPDPVAVLAAARRHLAPGGLVLMTYPDTEQNLNEGDINALMHEHLSYFTERSSRWAAQAAGLAVRGLERRAGAFVAVLEHPPEPLAPPQDLWEEDLLRRAAEMLNSLLLRTGGEIAARLEAGETVAFHGATNGLNSFLALTGLGSHPAIRVFDGDDSKVGQFLPACPTPILGSGDPSYPGHDAIYVSAVTFLPAIRRFAQQVHGLPAERLLPLVG
ncbi:class I SAM-dependent methyltransferase [Paramagnetospirillum magneticum]|uniref:SAM-dependent methyltransferase n=1 Tax=Paramagnetospirillum magneticum (strain ATCC 700264 / AMB-1) TaxID=342108 RepID=Q2WB90_PARM1|nr:class I SAM-dependent methyltransferase [Paramagnetospirillum magneticum]BAE48885.1 SAM-dependent methyltransferase [Paramagnetospirillum magneticum AMB-1]